MRDFEKWLDKAEAAHLASTDEREWTLGRSARESSKAHGARVQAWQCWFNAHGMAWVTVLPGGRRSAEFEPLDVRAAQLEQIGSLMQRCEQGLIEVDLSK